MTRAKDQRKLGLWAATSLVAGNMIGSGIFLLPSALAVFGGISMLGWIVSTVGAFALALIFSRLCHEMPSAGGPYVYAREGFGDFAGFLVVFGYWISVWCGNAAITVALISYSSVFFPVLGTDPIVAMMAGIGVVWLLTFINIRGVKEAGNVQLITLVLKVVPLLLMSIVGIFLIDFDHFVPFNRSDQSSFDAILATSALTLWAFLGVESATVPSDCISNPKKTIPYSTILGTSIAAMIYISSTVAIMGLVAPEDLVTSNAPFADAADFMIGPMGKYIIAITAIISTFGALNGWILMQGQVPKASARDGLFLSVFGKVNQRNVPAVGLVISSILVSILILMNFSKSLVEAFRFMILLSTITVLVPYIFSSGTYLLKNLKGKQVSRVDFIKHLLLGMLGFIFSIWAIAGSGEESVYWGFMLLLFAVPIYAWLKK